MEFGVSITRIMKRVKKKALDLQGQTEILKLPERSETGSENNLQRM